MKYEWREGGGGQVIITTIYNYKTESTIRRVQYTGCNAESALTGCPTQVAIPRMLSFSKCPLLLIFYCTLLRYFFVFFFLGNELYPLYSNTLDSRHPTHSRFRGSVNCVAPTMENSFQVAKYLFKVQKASSLHVWSKIAQRSIGLPVLASERVLIGP